MMQRATSNSAMAGCVPGAFPVEAVKTVILAPSLLYAPLWAFSSLNLAGEALAFARPFLFPCAAGLLRQAQLERRRVPRAGCCRKPGARLDGALDHSPTGDF